jgi:hypothetical protein
MLNTGNGNTQYNEIKITELFPKCSSAHYVHTNMGNYSHREILVRL